ncbi:MAG: anti-sigma factor [Pedobacter sp.]|uniref:anti-sigma factor n=1 Tax=Pedobacter sp. TaxID=1411316 RepID=UPI002807ED38|nr:anti-sigma factor [Pedobacter sp.]MDQ8006191.1 anti-sigma factor [Pedobacter sp.]
MDIKEYISSGIIEAYVMGLASEEEVRILECIQTHSPEVKQAILDAQSILEDFASREAIAPPPALKSAIWAKLQEESTDYAANMSNDELLSKQEALSHVQVETEPPTSSTPLYPSVVTESHQSPLKWYAIAASVLLIASIGLNLYLNGTQNNIKAELATLSNAQNTNEIAFNNLQRKWEMVNNPAIKAIPLAGVEKHPDMKAMVYFEKQSNEVYLTLENLPKAPQDQQYQLWAIVDGKPVSLGVFDQDSTTAVQKMLTVNAAQAFAITLEKRGGSPTPTMENMYVMGKV